MGGGGRVEISCVAHAARGEQQCEVLGYSSVNAAHSAAAAEILSLHFSQERVIKKLHTACM